MKWKWINNYDILNTAKDGCKQVYSILSEDVLDNAKKLFYTNH